MDPRGPLVPRDPQTHQDPLIHPVPQTPEASKETSLAEDLKETDEGGIQRKANRINRVKGVAQNCPMSQTLQIVRQKVSNSVQLKTILKE